MNERIVNLERLGTAEERARAGLGVVADIVVAGIESGDLRGGLHDALVFIQAWRVIEQRIAELRSHVSPEPSRRTESSRSRSPARRIRGRRGGVG